MIDIKKQFRRILMALIALLLFAGALRWLYFRTIAASIVIEPSEDTVFVGDTVTVSVTVYGNHIGAYSGIIDGDDIFSGFEGRFAEDCNGGDSISFSYDYIAESAGTGRITVSEVEVAVDDPDHPDDPMKIIKEYAEDVTCTITVLEKDSGKEDRLFNDVNDSDIWFYETVYQIAGTVNKNGNALMSGYEHSNRFGPADPLTRQDFAVILYRLEDEPDISDIPDMGNPFKDTDPAGYYYPSILWAKSKGVIAGYNDGRFGVGDKITREQVATILYRFAKEYKDIDTFAALKAGDLSKFNDGKAVSSWAKEALTWATGAGVITGKSNGTEVAARGDAARAEVGAMILRFMTYMEQQGTNK